MKEEEVVISVLTIQGLVQSVGFRPFIYRIASEMNICGEVDNRNNGVCIRTALTPVQRELFIERIRREHPKVASIHRITVSERIEVRNPYMGFRITPSRSESNAYVTGRHKRSACNTLLSTVRIADLVFLSSVICLMIGAEQPCQLSRCVRPAEKNI